MQPLGHVLRAVCFAGSADALCFYLELFFMPLFVPHEYVHFTLGDRLQKYNWKSTLPDLIPRLRTELVTVAHPYLSKLAFLDNVADTLKDRAQRGNPHTHEAYAYTCIMTDRISEASQALATLLAMLDEKSEWQHEIGDRARLIASKLSESVDTAKAQLLEWEEVTVRNLKLTEFR